MSLWSRISNVFRADRLNREIEEEFEAHIAEAIEQGRDPEAARRAFGAAVRQQQQSHDVRVVGWLDSLRADVVFGWRQLNRNKVTSAAAILSLALAIGACTAAFRLIDALLLRPLPVAHPERLYVLSRQGMGFDNKPGEWDSWAYPCFQLMRAAAKGQAELIALSYADRSDVTYKTDEEMEKANLQYVSGAMFSTFGIQPVLGRLLSVNDDRKAGAAPFAVLSYDYWSRRFGRDPHVLGRTVHIGDGVYEIVGVSEKKFTGTERGTIVDIFLPVMMHRSVTRPDSTPFRTMVVLNPEVPVEPFREKLAAVSHAFEVNRLSGETGLSQETLRNVLNNRMLMEPAPTGASAMQRDYRDALAILGGLVLMVLVIACANVANLMTAQATARAREMALRVSIGAGRGRLLQMVLVQSALLAFLAAASGALFAWWSAPFVVSMINPPDNPARLVLPADWRVLGFGCGSHFGGRPAIRASACPAGFLREAGERAEGWRRSAFAAAPDARDDCPPGCFLFFGALCRRSICRYVSAAFQQAYRVLNRPNSPAGDHEPARPVIALLGPGGGVSTANARRRARVNCRISFAEGFELERLNLHQWRAAQRQSCLLSQCLARVARDDEDSTHRRKGFWRERYLS